MHQIAVVTTDEGGLVGVDANTGRVRWSTRLRGHLRGFPAVDQGSGTVAMVWQDDPTSTELRLIDAGTGAVRWEQDAGGDGRFTGRRRREGRGELRERTR